MAPRALPTSDPVSLARGRAWRVPSIIPADDARQIRCSGFEASDDGRCTNCQRFQQECIFTPVSSQAQAFVPAHTAYPHLRTSGGIPAQRGGRSLYSQSGPPAIYGAHGQPLGSMQDPHYHPPGPHGYSVPAAPNPYPNPMYDERGPPHPYPKDTVSRKRPRSDESWPHPAVPPPPQEPSTQSPLVQGRPAGAGRRGSGSYEYPEPTPLVPLSPTSSVTSYQSAPYPPPPAQPYYAAQPRRVSPQSSSYSFEPRNSGSPHGSASSASNYPYPTGLHPPQALPPRESGHTPPPAVGRDGNGGNGGNGGSNGGNGSGQRGGMSVRDLLGPEGQAGRSSADSDMLKALNRRGM